MKQSKREALDLYYSEANSWAGDRLAANAKALRVTSIVMAVAVIVALCEGIALICLLPLKTVVPYTLMVDRQTGYVQALKPLDAEQLAPSAALTQSFLVQYVIARESFDISQLQSNYHKVALWSEGTAHDDYVAHMQVSNPASPLVRYPRRMLIDTTIRSVTPMGKNQAMVRFQTRRRMPDGRGAVTQSWVTVVRFRYSGKEMPLEDRFINPLGFEVSGYERSAETLPDAPPDSTAAFGKQP